MASVWATISAALGSPPKPDEEFTWEYYDKAGKFGSFKGTPREFLRAHCGTPTQSFSLIHDPRNPSEKLYTVAELGNVWAAREVLYVNTGIARLKAAVVKCVKAGVPVFFGCDVGKFSTRDDGIMDTEIYDIKVRKKCLYSASSS